MHLHEGCTKQYMHTCSSSPNADCSAASRSYLSEPGPHLREAFNFAIEQKLIILTRTDLISMRTPLCQPHEPGTSLARGLSTSKDFSLQRRWQFPRLLEAAHVQDGLTASRRHAAAIHELGVCTRLLPLQ